MKRDWDVVRVILDEAEKLPFVEGAEASKAKSNFEQLLAACKAAEVVPEPTMDSVKYHVAMLASEGYVRSEINQGGVVGLTWKGHNLQDEMGGFNLLQTAVS